MLLVGNYPHQAQESMARFAQMLAGCLPVAGVDAKLLSPAPLLGRLRPSDTGLGKWLGYLDRFLVFPWILLWARRRADVVHICDHGNAAYVPLLRNKPHLVTCHDLFGAQIARGEIPGYRTGWPGCRLAETMLRGLGRTQRVVCVSRATRDELFRLVPSRSQSDTTIIENGLNFPYRPMSAQEARARLDTLGIPSAPFLLHVGGNQWYKNRLGAVDIFDHLRRYPGFELLRLVLAGKPWDDNLRRFVAERGLAGQVLECVGAADEDLRALYSAAEAVIFPSLAEGFGWPVVEAQACGCPVFASNRSPMTEVGGDAAVYFDPARTADAAATISRHWDKREEQSRAGPENARRFSAERMVGQYIQQYRELVSGGGESQPRA